MVEAIKNCYVDLGPKLEEKIATLSELSEKAACVWSVSYTHLEHIYTEEK